MLYFVRYFSVAAIVFALVAIGTPALLGYTLWSQRAVFLKQTADSLHFDPLSTPTAFVMGCGFFYKPFKSRLIYWEAVELSYKLSLTAIITFMAPGTTLQVYIGANQTYTHTHTSSLRLSPAKLCSHAHGRFCVPASLPLCPFSAAVCTGADWSKL